MLASILISVLLFFLMLCRNMAYLVKIASLTDVMSPVSTLYTKKVKVDLGTSHASFAAVFQHL